MRFDIRWLVGFLFIVYGKLLVVHGMSIQACAYYEPPHASIDTWWGGVMWAFGVAMGVLAQRTSRPRI